MKITCPNCSAVYQIDGSRIKPGGSKVRCKKCSHIFSVSCSTERATSAPAQDPRAAAETFLESCLLLDLETGRDNKIHRIGAVFGEKSFVRKDKFSLPDALADLDAFSAGATHALGHNLVSHDLPILASIAPDLALLRIPVIDTLYLSPLAFPQNPYHRLIKDYKLVSHSLSDPVADARLSAVLFCDQWESFAQEARSCPDLLPFFRYATAAEGENSIGDHGGVSNIFARISGAPEVPVIGIEEALQIFARVAGKRICKKSIEETLGPLLAHPADRISGAYALAWLRVGGGNSVIPIWVRKRFPVVAQALRAMRDIPCGDSSCTYCAETHDPVAQVQRYFGYPEFRRLPTGEPLQEEIVARGMSDGPLLGILPTGFGKSLCFQLPALVRYYRRGLLTVVISPLLSLMKDQKENLQAHTGTEAVAAIYGMLTGPERGAALDGVRMGDIGLLYISPEQLRNRSVRDALKYREIGAWVFDEAHCLSKWGHDFRPDYLYASRFIREFAESQGAEIPPVVCLTATAKKDVIEEILHHFKDNLGQILTLFPGGHERENLEFSVESVTSHNKHPRIAELLRERIAQGSAIVYCATRKKTVKSADYLKETGLDAAAFHADIHPAEKRRVQEAFTAGELAIICATNAFGMGIDKPDVRLVIHSDIPGSLENYLQEAGRAGRDLGPAQCILLYNEEDIETQFGLAALSEIRKRDIEQILRGLRKLKQDEEGNSVITTGDLLQDDEMNVSFDADQGQADTKVKAAVAWLERAGFLERNENRTRVFQGEPRFKSMEEACKKLDRLDLSPGRRRIWETVLETLLNSDPDQGISADELFRDLAGFGAGSGEAGLESSRDIMDILHQMSKVGLIRQGIRLSAFVRAKGKNNAKSILSHVCDTEIQMLKILQESYPDDHMEGWLTLGLRGLVQMLRDQGVEEANPERIKGLLRSLAQDGRGFAGERGSILFRHKFQDQWRLKLQKSWASIVEIAKRRQAIAWVILEAIIQGIGKAPVGEVLVQFSSDDLADALQRDFAVQVSEDKASAAIDRGLMFLHEQRVILLQKGLAVFRQAITFRILPEAKGRRYSKGDFALLEHHYEQRRFQIHVMNEYARLGLNRISRARQLGAAYFSQETDEFIGHFFSDRKDLLDMATGESSFKAIVGSLKNPIQESIVASTIEKNALILAGPGSGKTRVVVHRCAYLLRVKRVLPSGVLILCFNHGAALSVRRRLRELVGEDATGVTVLTYHGLAMRLTGTSFAARAETGAQAGEADPGTRFDEVIREATALLKGEKELPGIDADETRDRLLGGYAHILVDEYQDIDGDQYELISAIAGRSLNDPELKLSILAVGDDDQSIYGFRNANVVYIRRFRDDYDARIHHLVENYRSSGRIIGAANSLIRLNTDRMKTDQPIRVNRLRAGASPGGDWGERDPVTQGKVGRIAVGGPGGQAAALVQEIRRMKVVDPDLDFGDVAVLARNGMGCGTLSAVRGAFEADGIPFSFPLDRESGFAVHRIREIADILDTFSRMPNALHRATELMNRVEQGSDPENPWPREILRVLDDWKEESGDALLPVRSALDFLYEAFVEQKREHRMGQGVHLSTAHGAKGLEFEHVFILDGDWRPEKDVPKLEEERRLYYVAMTRAKGSLTLFLRKDCCNPHALHLDPDHVLDREIIFPEEKPRGGFCQYDVLGMRHFYIGYAANYPEGARVHGAISRLKPGDPLSFRNGGNRIFLTGPDGADVAQLSKMGQAEWKDRTDAVERMTVLGMVRRYARETAPEYRDRVRCDRWEVPVVEVVSRAG